MKTIASDKLLLILGGADPTTNPVNDRLVAAGVGSASFLTGMKIVDTVPRIGKPLHALIAGTLALGGAAWAYALRPTQ